MQIAERAPRKEIVGWAMFDFANSSYTTVIITVAFSVVFPKLIVGDAPDYRLGNLLWSVGLSISYALVVLLAPALGAYADAHAAKKRLLFASWLFTVVTTAALWLATPGNVALAMFLLVVSNLGFALGESIVSAFLPELGPKDQLGSISGFAWGLGYVGGLLSTFVIVTVVGEQTLENFERVRLIGPMTAAFFFVAALPTFAWLRERAVPHPGAPGTSPIRESYARLRATLSDVRGYRDLARFFGSLFFSMAGLSVAISFAFIYGDQVIRWSPGAQVGMFVLTNVAASVGAIAFGKLQSRWGNLRTYRLTLIVWVVAVLAIASTKSLAGLLAGVAPGVTATNVYLVVGALAGLCLGATQSSGRTIVAIFAPGSKSGEFFGFWGLFGKLAAIFGLLSLGLLQQALGLETAILVCAAFFATSYALSLGVDEARGIEAARAHDEA